LIYMTNLIRISIGVEENLLMRQCGGFRK